MNCLHDTGSRRLDLVLHFHRLEHHDTGTDLDPASHTALSGWRYSLAPGRGKGRRERAEIEWLDSTSVRELLPDRDLETHKGRIEVRFLD